KERLIPELAVLGRPVRQMVLPRSPGCFYDTNTYIKAVGSCLERIAAQEPGLQPVRSDLSCRLWAAEDVQIDDRARLFGQVVVFPGARIGKDTIVVGPTLVGPNVTIGDNAVLANSVLWPGAQVLDGAYIDHCVITGQRSWDKARVECQVVADERRQKGTVRSGSIPMPTSGSTRRQLAATAIAAIGLAGILWSFWPQWQDLWARWRQSDEYSAGMLVPGLAAYVLWCRRNELKDLYLRPSAWGMGLLILSQVIRLYGLYQMRGFVERSSVVIGIMGLALWLGGKELFKKTFTALLFLILMLPWPQGLHNRVALPLQVWSTSSAVFGLELLGYDVIREGNVIQIGQTSVAVAEACNGLRMITAFVIISSMLALLVNRTWWEKLVMLLSSLPIALACNTTRLILTAIAFTMISGPRWEKAFHDFGGYAMMPLAVAMVMGELWLLRLLTTAPTSRPQPDIIIRSSKKDSV
ncbi:MAG: exosortase, partial [Sedimentisphaerales bacterium]|nr:exosortase [Sedimentisphaerales bacterium]